MIVYCLIITAYLTHMWLCVCVFLLALSICIHSTHTSSNTFMFICLYAYWHKSTDSVFWIFNAILCKHFWGSEHHFPCFHRDLYLKGPKRNSADSPMNCSYRRFVVYRYQCPLLLFSVPEWYVPNFLACEGGLAKVSFL